jgi:dTDP-4-amino-4,6-dideoxygalactose transaminase
VVTDSEEVAARARLLRFHGSLDKVTHTEVGYNSRLDSMQAAVLRLLLPELDGWTLRRQEVAERYRALGLGELVRLPEPTPGASHAYHLYVTLTDAADELAARLGHTGVQARSYYRVPTHRQPAMTRYAGAELPATDDVAERNLALPMGPELTAEQAEAVVAALESSPAATTR